MLKRSLINCFLICFLLVMAIDSAPRSGNWHGKLKKGIDPYLKTTGLWQGGWALFAPMPDMVNAAIATDLYFPDGEKLELRTPNWRELSAWQRFVLFRQAEFVDDLRSDNHLCVHPSYCKYIRRTTPHPTNDQMLAKEVLVSRHWVVIPRPNTFTMSQFPEPPLPFDSTNSLIMSVEEYRSDDGD